MNESTDNLMDELEKALKNVHQKNLGIDLEPEIEVVADDNVVFRYEKIGIRMELLEIHVDSKRVPTAEIVVSASKNKYPNITRETIYRDRVNLVSNRSKTSFVKTMCNALPPLADSWTDIVESITEETLKIYREGNDIMTIGSIEDDDIPSYQVFPLIRSDGINILFGAGAQGKSFLATFICMLVQGGVDHAGLAPEQGNVLYLDWEDSWRTVNKRIKALRKGNNELLPDIRHIEMAGKTIDTELPDINKKIETENISLVVIDSFGVAAGGNQNESDYVKNIMNKINRLNASVLIIDHPTKMDGDTPTGSSYKGTSARNVWKMQKSQDLGANIVDVGVYHTKANNSKMFQPLGMRIEFLNDINDQVDKVVITSIDVKDHEDLVDSLPVHEKLEKLLKQGQQTVLQLAQGTNTNVNVVRTELSKRGNKFMRVEKNTYALNPRYYGTTHN